MPTFYRFDQFEVEPESFVLRREGLSVVLEPKGFDLLCYLLRHPNRTLSKNELLDAIWKDVAVTDNVLARAIVLLRRALSDDARTQRYVQTVPTRGYKFCPGPSFYYGSRSNDLAFTHPSSQRQEGGDEATVAAIAVLPFVNASGDPADEHFADGISEEILNGLTRGCGFQVAARASSFAFRTRTCELHDIAARLRVDYIVEGTVRRIDQRVRIAAQLVDPKTGYQIWSARFDRDLTDVFAVHDEIAQAVSNNIRQKLRAAQAVTQVRNRKVNRDAYDAYLKGRQLSQQRFVEMGEAQRCFERAISLDPSFAPAYCALSEHYLFYGLYAGRPATEAFLAMRRYAEEALVLEPQMAEPHYLLAAVSLYYEWNRSACERHLNEVVSKEPHHARAATLRASLFALCRQVASARSAADHALRIDPLGTETRTWVLATAWLTSDFDRQIMEADRLIADYPGFSDAYRWRSMAHTARGDYASARADLTRFSAMTNQQLYALVGLATVAALEGHVAEARAIRQEMAERAKREWVPPMAFGQVEQQLGNYDCALDWYERAYQARDFLLMAMHVDPQFRMVPQGQTAPITNHPRWADLVSRIGLAPK